MLYAMIQGGGSEIYGLCWIAATRFLVKSMSFNFGVMVNILGSPGFLMFNFTLVQGQGFVFNIESPNEITLQIAFTNMQRMPSCSLNGRKSLFHVLCVGTWPHENKLYTHVNVITSSSLAGIVFLLYFIHRTCCHADLSNLRRDPIDSMLAKK